METRWIVLIAFYVVAQACAMGFLYLTLCEVLRRIERIDAQRVACEIARIAATHGGSDADR